MSCLYSSPELKPPDRRFLEPGHRRAHACQRSEFRRSSDPCRFRQPSSSKDAFPTTDVVAGEPSFSLSKHALFSCVGRQSAISGFRSICGRKRRSSHQPSRSIRPAFRNLSPGAACRENPGILPASSRALHRCCGRNVVAPCEYSKRFLRSNPLYNGIFRPATARGTPARSAFGLPCSVNPQATMKVSIGRLWPCPASTTSTPPGPSRPVACGIMAR